MRGLRTSTDQLRTADPVLAEKLTDINQRLEFMTMTVAQGGDDEIGQTETGKNTIGYLLLTQRRLLEERNTLITHIQSLPGLEHFLRSPSLTSLMPLHHTDPSSLSTSPTIISLHTLSYFSRIRILSSFPPLPASTIVRTS